MRKVKIDDIISRLNIRNDNGASRQFIRIFSRVVRDYLDYKRWVNSMISKNGQYQNRGQGEIIPRFIEYIYLIEDIAENGIKEPVKEFNDGMGYEIDGYHRMIIWKELGHDTIEIGKYE